MLTTDIKAANSRLSSWTNRELRWKDSTLNSACGDHEEENAADQLAVPGCAAGRGPGDRRAAPQPCGLYETVVSGEGL